MNVGDQTVGKQERIWENKCSTKKKEHETLTQ